MPVLSLGHSKFWRARANIPPPPAPVGNGGYPAWQSSVITSSAFGSLQVYWEKFVYAFQWFRWAWRSPLTGDQQRAVNEAITVVQHPGWIEAQLVVFNTSRAEGFHDHHVWNEISHQLAYNIGWAENMWRHMHALIALEQSRPEMDNPT